MLGTLLEFRAMILIRKALRIATLVAAYLAIAYIALNQTTGQPASILALIGIGTIINAWASAWHDPGPSFEEMRIDRIAKRILKG